MEGVSSLRDEIMRGLFEIWSHINRLIEALNNCASECNGGVFKMWPVIDVFMEGLKHSKT
jgi:hypothetical protein